MSNAGESARREAESAAKTAEHLRRKAEFARRRAESFASGAEGEVAVAEALAPLAAAGWYVLSDRVNPAGGNIDHIVIGPGAVVVLDAKAWNSKLEVRNGRLYASGWNKARELEGLNQQAESVQRVVGSDVVVDQALVITTQPDFEPQKVGKAGVLGINFLHSEINQTPTAHSQAQVESIFSKVAEAFPPAGTVPSAASGLQIVDAAEPSELFNRSHRFLYTSLWRKYGKQRLYLKDEAGEDLGFADLVSGQVTVSYPDDQLAHAVLKGASSTGVRLSPKDLPKIPVDLPGGRLLGLFGRL